MEKGVAPSMAVFLWLFLVLRIDASSHTFTWHCSMMCRQTLKNLLITEQTGEKEKEEVSSSTGGKRSTQMWRIHIKTAGVSQSTDKCDGNSSRNSVGNHHAVPCCNLELVISINLVLEMAKNTDPNSSIQSYEAVRHIQNTMQAKVEVHSEFWSQNHLCFHFN